MESSLGTDEHGIPSYATWECHDSGDCCCACVHRSSILGDRNVSPRSGSSPHPPCGRCRRLHSLTVEIKDGRLSCRFEPGFIHKSFLVSEMKEVRSVRNPWYAGWGIRYLPGRYWLWNVSGFLAVELILEDGQLFGVGTDEPELLIQAIHMNGVLNATNINGEI